MGQIQVLLRRSSALPGVTGIQGVSAVRQTLGALLLDARRDFLHRMFRQGFSLGASPKLVWTQDDLIPRGTATTVREAVPLSRR